MKWWSQIVKNKPIQRQKKEHIVKNMALTCWEVLLPLILAHTHKLETSHDFNNWIIITWCEFISGSTLLHVALSALRLCRIRSPTTTQTSLPPQQLPTACTVKLLSYQLNSFSPVVIGKPRSLMKWVFVKKTIWRGKGWRCILYKLSCLFHFNFRLYVSFVAPPQLSCTTWEYDATVPP